MGGATAGFIDTDPLETFPPPSLPPKAAVKDAKEAEGTILGEIKYGNEGEG